MAVIFAHSRVVDPDGFLGWIDAVEGGDVPEIFGRFFVVVGGANACKKILHASKCITGDWSGDFGSTTHPVRGLFGRGYWVFVGLAGNWWRDLIIPHFALVGVDTTEANGGFGCSVYFCEFYIGIVWFNSTTSALGIFGYNGEHHKQRR